MDLATLIGWLCAGSMLVFGIGLDGILRFIDIPSIILVAGGGIGATLISLNMNDAIGSIKTGMQILFHQRFDAVDLIKRIVEFSEVARRDGILALENVTDQIKDEFLVKGIRLAVDGTDPELIETILNNEVSCIRARHERATASFKTLEKYAPGWGMMGTVIGLVNMLAVGMDDPSALTAGMAVALITTFYGSLVGNFFIGPAASKLVVLSADEMMIKKIIIKGVLSIQSGDNPRIVEMKLKTFLPPSARNFGKDVEGQ
jgi:chemotaxis protein MotA